MTKIADLVRILDVDYYRQSLADGTLAYLTEQGLPFADKLLALEFWQDGDFKPRRFAERLEGTSSVWRLDSPELGKRLVIKWNRMGEDIPGGTGATFHKEFNSPFEELQMVMELLARTGSSRSFMVQQPLGIYVKNTPVDLEILGRKEYRMVELQKIHPPGSIDQFRQYAVIYEWMEGIDLRALLRVGAISEQQAAEFTDKTRKILRDFGFDVADHKSAHLVIDTIPSRDVPIIEDKDLCWGLIDYELMARVSEQEYEARNKRRKSYLGLQSDRFREDASEHLMPNLAQVEVMGVPYIHGPAESTGGALWVVGNRGALFDYFRPERLESENRVKLSPRAFHVVTKDNINLVEYQSRVGELPDMDPSRPDEKRILEYGFNSPFEEFSIALDLMKEGVLITYPRAIYMTGTVSNVSEILRDHRRYDSHRTMLASDGAPVLRADRDYIVIWGFWNGPDEKLAENDGEYHTAINALQAYKLKYLTESDYIKLVNKFREILSSRRVEDLNLRGTHLLLSLKADGGLLRADDGLPEVRVCNFELLKRV